MSRQIKTQPTRGQLFSSRATPPVELSGWLDARQTYLWFGVGGRCAGYLEGKKLYRLAKAIVRQFEEPIWKLKKDKRT